MAYFPMFVEIKDHPCLVAGGGAVALRKVEKLLEFGARVRVVAPHMHPELEKLSEQENGPELIRRPIQEMDLEGQDLVIAATDDARQNHWIAARCRQLHIPVNAVDQKEDCTFLFPAIVREGDLVAAFSSGGKSPLMTQYLKEKEKEILTPRMGQINELLGAVRESVRQSYDNESDRKAAFRRIMEMLMEAEELPEAEELLWQQKRK